MDQAQETFKNLERVYCYLKANGWKTSRASLHEKAFLLKKNEDGSYSKNVVDAFAASRLQRQGDDPGNIEKRAHEELKRGLELRKLRADAEKRELELQIRRGQMLPRHEVEQQFAARCAFLAGSLRNFGHSHIPQLLTMTKADMNYVSLGIEFYLNELNTLFDSYCRPLELPGGEVAAALGQEAQ